MDEVMIVRNMEAVRLVIRKEFRERRDRLVAEHKCLGCERELAGAGRVSRGLCTTCYQATRYAIRQGRTTDEALLRRGVILPQGRCGQKPKNAFTAEMAGRA